MTYLTVEQIQFLEQQGISLSKVFDATGMSTPHYREAMSKLGMTVAFGVSACSKAGHTLRTRGGHCAQCNTAALAFVARYDKSAEVYVAYSPILELTKIGVANGHQDRVRSLNDQGYGGVKDWSVKFYCKYEQAGRVEFLAQRILSQYRRPSYFVRSGNTVRCQELFKCDVILAVKAIKNAAKGTS